MLYSSLHVHTVLKIIVRINNDALTHLCDSRFKKENRANLMIILQSIQVEYGDKLFC